MYLCLFVLNTPFILDGLFIYCTATDFELIPSFIVSAPLGHTLPLSCVFTLSNDVILDTLTFEWSRRTSLGTASFAVASNNTTNHTYQSSSGVTYYVMTLFLCDVDYEDAGLYECSAMGAVSLMPQELFFSITPPFSNVSVHGKCVNKKKRDLAL